MDRSRRQGASEAPSAPPVSSRLTVRARKNRRRPSSLWARLPPPRVVGSACGRALRRSLPALVGSAALATVAALGAVGYHFVTTSPRFAVTDVEIRGAHHLAPDAIRAALPVRAGDNVFAASLDTITRDLLGDPWIASASAHRVLPHTIVVELHERTPVAVVDLDGLYLVEADGHPFKRAELADGDGAGLPVITGVMRAAYTSDPEGAATTVRGALAALATWQSSAARPSIGEIHVDPHGAVTFHTYDHATAIQLGALEPAITARMSTFDIAWAELDPAERLRARAVHLDARPDHVTVAFAPAAPTLN